MGTSYSTSTEYLTSAEQSDGLSSTTALTEEVTNTIYETAISTTSTSYETEQSIRDMSFGLSKSITSCYNGAYSYTSFYTVCGKIISLESLSRTSRIQTNGGYKTITNTTIYMRNNIDKISYSESTSNQIRGYTTIGTRSYSVTTTSYNAIFVSINNTSEMFSYTQSYYYDGVACNTYYSTYIYTSQNNGVIYNTSINSLRSSGISDSDLNIAEMTSYMTIRISLTTGTAYTATTNTIYYTDTVTTNTIYETEEITTAYSGYSSSSTSGGVTTYRPLECRSSSDSATYYTSMINSEGLSSTTALTEISTTATSYDTVASTTNTIYETYTVEQQPYGYVLISNYQSQNIIGYTSNNSYSSENITGSFTAFKLNTPYTGYFYASTISITTLYSYKPQQQALRTNSTITTKNSTQYMYTTQNTESYVSTYANWTGPSGDQLWSYTTSYHLITNDDFIYQTHENHAYFFTLSNRQTTGMHKTVITIDKRTSIISTTNTIYETAEATTATSYLTAEFTTAYSGVSSSSSASYSWES